MVWSEENTTLEPVQSSPPSDVHDHPDEIPSNFKIFYCVFGAIVLGLAVAACICLVSCYCVAKRFWGKATPVKGDPEANQEDESSKPSPPASQGKKLEPESLQPSQLPSLLPSPPSAPSSPAIYYQPLLLEDRLEEVESSTPSISSSRSPPPSYHT